MFPSLANDDEKKEKQIICNGYTPHALLFYSYHQGGILLQVGINSLAQNKPLMVVKFDKERDPYMRHPYSLVCKAHFMGS